MTGTLIVGGGAIGLSLAWNLAKRGVKDITLLERNQLTSGTSWHAAGIVGPLRATPNMTRLAMKALEVFPELEAETGMSTGYRRTGGYWLARAPERMDELHRIAAVGQHFGLNAEIISPEDLKIPGLNLANHVGALTVEEDANVNPVDLCMAYARAAKARGVVIRENTSVAGIFTGGNRARGVRLTDGTEIRAETIALCAGAWSKRLAATAKVPLPLQAVEHMYVVTEPIPDLVHPFPVIRDLESGIYLKGDAGRLVIGAFEPDAKCWDAFGPEGDRPFLELPEDWDQFGPFMEAALDLVPALAETGIQRFMNGPESFTADSRPLVGEAPQMGGLYVAAGMNSVGVMSSAGIGSVLADWMIDGAPPFDLWEVDIARADPLAADNAHMQDRMREAVSDNFAVHWPYKQPKAGRGLRKSMLHDQWAVAGAVFGVTAGWERPLWFAKGPEERDLPYSVGRQPWEPIAAREAQAMAEGAALVDLAPLSRLVVKGRDAAKFMQWICVSDVDRLYHTTYTQMLNTTGGIEIDATVTSWWTGERRLYDRFEIFSAAATRWRDLAWIQRQAAGFNVTVTDISGEEQTIGVMGPLAKDLFEEIFLGYECCDEGSRNAYQIAYHAVGYSNDITLRQISYVGEFGWEFDLYPRIASTFFNQFRGYGVTCLGNYAVDGCRIEKGYKHWGHDLGPDITPLEAGLGFTIDWNKDFIGKDALLRQRETGIRQRLVLFEMPPEPLMLHDEPVLRGGRVIGFTTSGAMGPRTGLNLAFALINIEPGETLTEICAGTFEIEVAGQRYPAKALRRPPYDPTGERMRG